MATEYDRTSAQLLLRGLYSKGVFPLPKANWKEHLEENLGAFELRVGDGDMKMLDDLNEQ